MFKIFALCIGFIALGVSLAGTTSWPRRPGYMGAAILIAGAVSMRWDWRKRELATGDDPNASERRLWLYLTGTALILGYVATVLMTPGSEIHRKTGDTGGFDSWAMLAGAVVAYAIIQNGNLHKDERDHTIETYGNKIGYNAMVSFVVAFLLALGFAPPDLMQRFTHWLIANTLLSLIMAASLAQYVAQLKCYVHDGREAEGTPTPPAA